MKGCVFLTAGDAAQGFLLAGFRQIVADAATLATELERVVRSGEAGLVIVDERLLDEENVGLVHGLEKNWPGAMVVLPAPGEGEEAGAGDYGNRLIARVLGYQMKLS